MKKTTKIILLVTLIGASVALLVSCHTPNATPTTAVQTGNNTSPFPTVTQSDTQVSPPDSNTHHTTVTQLPTYPYPTKGTETLATPTPTELPEPVLLYKSGSISSDTGTYLNLVCNWSVEKIEDTSNYIFTTVVVLESYSLYCTGRNNGHLVIGDEIDTNYYSPEINIDKEAGFQTTYFTAQTCVLDRDQIRSGIDILASWAFYGSYSGVELDTITASGHITFCE